MSSSIVPYNVTLGSESPLWNYAPQRDGLATQGWNASYSGATVYVAGNDGIGTPFRHTQYNGASFEIQFEGTGYWLCLTHDTGVTFNLTVNGHTIATSGLPADSTCSEWPQAKTIVGAGGLAYRSLTVGLNISLPNADSSFDFYGGITQISAGAPGAAPVNPVTIDDRNPGWNYQPWPWLQSEDPSDYNETHSYACAYDSSVSAAYTFNETTAVMLIGSPDTNTFGYTISFQGVQSVYNASTFWHSYKQVLFMAGGLDPTTSYTLAIADYDPNQPNGPDLNITNPTYCVNLDAIILLQLESAGSSNSGTTSALTSPTASPDQNGNGSSISGGTIAGAVVGAIGGLGILMLLVLFFLYWRRRTQNATDAEPFPAMSEVTDLVSPAGLRPAVPYSPMSMSDPKAGRGYFDRRGVPDASARPPLTPSSSNFNTVQASSPQPGTLSDSTATSDALTAPGRSRVQAPGAVASPALLENAATVDLVQVLNQRLRHGEHEEAPPGYQDAQ
ncbi:hypothetical protein DACRYDRAFT_108349 [Dacryopinax primogenitus]|uniref:Uncharacterized protein n=1 Tax=Dacryopinax primogenitus (strain DJM 731) TaxID=1858805 RepID=M5FTN7_DACPD|nr:uncharacterized protein DACRYDRAFT_108349 [Dacryopinax primogenitus]EJU01016.1 hypothetical protein DACRYDRAFT_108349 [Dacryopinax primogenitus]